MTEPTEGGHRELVTAAGVRSVAAGLIVNSAVNTGDTRLAWRPRLPEDVPAPAGGMRRFPRRPASLFLGRDPELDRLAGVTVEGPAVVVTQAVVGLGGIGKSELALQHAASWARDGSGRCAWWIDAGNPELVDEGLAELGRRVEPGWPVEVPAADVAGWTVGWLASHPGWLLVLDNVETPAELDRLADLDGAGRLLVTTRRHLDWAGFAGGAVVVRLDELGDADAVALLVGRSGRDEPAAVEVAAELGGLPLALEQAAAYVRQTRTVWSNYLEALRERPVSLYRAVPDGGDPSRTVARVWDVTLATIADRHPDAVKLLTLLSCYGPQPLPRTVLIGGSGSVLTQTEGWGLNRLEVNTALGILASYSMIELTDSATGVHRLVAAVVRDRAGASLPVPMAARLLDAALPIDPSTNVGGWSTWRDLLPHVDVCAALAGFPDDSDIAHLVSSLLNGAALFRYTQGDYAASADNATKALTITETAFGGDHPDVASSLANLAACYRAMGRAVDAVPLQERALTITETALGPEHPIVGILLDNLAISYRELGRAGDAVPLHKRALTITETALGPDHPTVATRLGNLAISYRELGRADDAVPLHMRALTIAETALGPDHPDVASALGNLAASYRALGHVGDAVPLEERALTITETTLGPNHPTVAVALGNLALSYIDMGRPGEAGPLQERGLTITETALGPNHPDVAVALGNLAGSYRGLGRTRDAVPLQRRALTITETALGPNHPDVAVALGNLAGSYRALGRSGEAVPLVARAVRIATDRLGSGHPTTRALAIFFASFD